MNKEVFIQQLRSKLKRLPQEEIDYALGYYVEYFQEAGIDNEEDVLKNLDSPSNIASQILSDYAFKDDVINTKKSKKRISSIGFIILAIFAAPVALPLALALIMLGFAMIIVVGALIFAFSLTSISLVVAGIITIFVGAAVFTQGFATAIMFIGIGLIFIGIGLLSGIAIVILTPKVFKGISKLARKLLSRINKSNSKEEI